MTDTTYTMTNFSKDLTNIKNNLNKRIAYIQRAFVFAIQHSLAGQHTPLTSLIDVLTLRDKQALNVLMTESTCLKIKSKKSKKGNNVYQCVNTESSVSDSDNVELLKNAPWLEMYNFTKTNAPKDFTNESALQAIKALIAKCNKNGIDFDSVLNEYRHKQA